LDVLSKIIKDLNIKLKYVDLGGGFGITYSKKDKQINLNNYAKLVYTFKKKLNCNIIFEPGRSLVGNAGILVSKIQYIKKGLNKDFIIIDAGMNDFMRTALYDASHDIVPIIRTNKKSKESIEFVGPICETTCKFTKYKKYQKIKEGDFVAITNVGAYGSSLSSNYNTKPFIAEILASKNIFKIIRKKQDLLKLINS
jgi:diaminopimelate decarboxylase